jgi:formylmethanofuran dehydrogenase subunit E-like metal-binding protein
MKKSEIQQKRNEILKKIDDLQSKCNCFSAEETSNCSNCKVIAEYGQMLLHLSNKRVTVSGADAKLKNRKPDVTLVITESQYHEYKKQMKKDKEIAAIFNVSASTLSKWKRKNHIAR